MPCSSAMPRYSAFVALDEGPGYLQELDHLIDAPDPRAAAQQAFQLAMIHPDDQFPQVLIVEEQAVSIFVRGDHGEAVTPDEDFARLEARGPAAAIVHCQAADRATEGDPNRR